MSRGRRGLAAAVCAVVAVGALIAQAPAVAVDRVDRATLLSDLRALAADDMQGREVGTPGGERARAYILSRFRAVGLEPVGASFEHSFGARLGRSSAGTPRTGVNLVGVIRGTARPDLHIVLSAHYDHIGTRGGVVFNGANDNASGTAALFEVARYFVANRPSVSILVVAFDAEEPGLVGSRAFVREPPVPLDRMLVNVNADMVARDPDNVLFVVGVTRQPALRPMIERVVPRARVKLTIGHEGLGGRADEDWTRDSDQFAFIEAGVPGLLFSTEDYAQQHRATDDFETITADFYVNAVETLIDVIREFDASADALVRTRQ